MLTARSARTAEDFLDFICPPQTHGGNFQPDRLEHKLWNCITVREAPAFHFIFGTNSAHFKSAMKSGVRTIQP